jgi:hypothetical protein
MLDPVTLNHLAKLRQQEFLDQAALDREPRVSLIQWSRLLEPIYALLQRRSRRSVAYQPLTTIGQTTLEECPCE